MATYTITATTSGSNKDNDAQRSISTVFPYDAAQYRTISEITRRDGIWCSCGGSSQSVTLSGYDQLINSSTGAVIKTSDTGTCRCKGTGPAADNYMTCTFSNWTQAESNAAVAAWAAGTLTIKRTVSITAYTSSNHGAPAFRDGQYDDTITITGSTAPFTNYRPQIETFRCFRSEDGVTESQLSTTVYTTIKLAMNDTSGLNDSPKLVLEYSTRADFSADVTSITVATSASIFQYYLDGYTISVRGDFSVGSNYYFRLTFSAGEESVQVSGVSVSMSYTPLHIPQNNAGIALGMYSNSTEDDSRCEINYPLYLYRGVRRIPTEMLQDSLAALGVQCGSTETVSCASSSTASFTLTFSPRFLAPPKLIVSLGSSLQTYRAGQISAYIVPDMLTEYGCTVVVSNYSGSASSVCAHWIAIGQPDWDNSAITVVRPQGAMTGNSSLSCNASASTTYSSSYPAWKAFNGSAATSWASTSSDSAPWIQLEMDVALANIQVSVYSRSQNASAGNHNPTAGTVQGSNDGSSWVQIGTYSGWSEKNDGTLLGTIECGNDTAYRYVRLNVTSRAGSEYVAIGYISIRGDI